MFKHELHEEICKAIIKAVKKRKLYEYDNKKTYQIIKDYFYDVNNTIETAFCFCPDDKTILDIMELEIGSLKGKI